MRTRSARVLCDLGSGALGNLLLTLPYPQLDGVVVSHMHADHFLDVIPLRYGLTYGPLLRAERLPLWLPPGGTHVLRTLCRAFTGEAGDFLNAVYAVNEYDPARALQIEDLRLTFSPTLHYVESYSIRGECGAASFTYSGDSAPCDALIAHARNSSLFVCEATLGVGTEDSPRGHSSAAEAGEMAARAGVERLALTHYYANADVEMLVDAAQTRFSGPVCAVADGDEFLL
ncbi:MAG: MBL fold metallo-hydrolase [Candidatus Eremiobacteraeota bacterium]|nr:MBL fold metallo-hydrolase [Candidatus Eremiobacteraeota bacterium]